MGVGESKASSPVLSPIMNNWVSVVFTDPDFMLSCCGWGAQSADLLCSGFTAGLSELQEHCGQSAGNISCLSELQEHCGQSAGNISCLSDLAFKLGQKLPLSLVKCRSFVCFLVVVFFTFVFLFFQFYLRLAEAPQSQTRFFISQRQQKRLSLTSSCFEILLCVCVCALLRFADSHTDPLILSWHAVSKPSDVAAYTVFQTDWAHSFSPSS